MDIVIALAVVPAGCDFAALDGQPVRLIAMIAAPARHPAHYLQVLAAVAAQLARADVRERMLAATNGTQVVSAFLTPTAHAAARGT